MWHVTHDTWHVTCHMHIYVIQKLMPHCPDFLPREAGPWSLFSSLSCTLISAWNTLVTLNCSLKFPNILSYFTLSRPFCWVLSKWKNFKITFEYVFLGINFVLTFEGTSIVTTWRRGAFGSGGKHGGRLSGQSWSWCWCAGPWQQLLPPLWHFGHPGTVLPIHFRLRLCFLVVVPFNLNCKL